METIILTIFFISLVAVLLMHPFDDDYDTEDYFEIDED